MVVEETFLDVVIGEEMDRDDTVERIDHGVNLEACFQRDRSPLALSGLRLFLKRVHLLNGWLSTTRTVLHRPFTTVILQFTNLSRIHVGVSCFQKKMV